MTFRYQAFTSPGTWTNPGSVTEVQVTVVGGGGGGTNPGTIVAGGGGGAVRKEWAKVSGPVPITVGAGGTAANPIPSATEGGTSAFGPLGPGPIPTIPATTIAAGGGARGGAALSAPLQPIGGGGGEDITLRAGGRYGLDGVRGGAGSGGYGAVRISDRKTLHAVGWGEDYYGNGGTGGSSNSEGAITYGTPGTQTVFGVPAPTPVSAPPTACANTGGGGCDASAPGSAGIVIVRWFE